MASLGLCLLRLLETLRNFEHTVFNSQTIHSDLAFSQESPDFLVSESTDRRLCLLIKLFTKSLSHRFVVRVSLVNYVLIFSVSVVNLHHIKLFKDVLLKFLEAI